MVSFCLKSYLALRFEYSISHPIHKLELLLSLSFSPADSVTTENQDKTDFPICLSPRQQCLINCCTCLAEMSLGIRLPTAPCQVHCKTSIWLSGIPGQEETLSLPPQHYLWLFKGKIILLGVYTGQINRASCTGAVSIPVWSLRPSVMQQGQTSKQKLCQNQV